MNKKVLSAILFGALMAGTGTFTSCIDNDEPAGIEELRGAKAELLRAKAAVEAAKVALVQAEAAAAQAEADLQKALAAAAQAESAAEIARLQAEAEIAIAKAESIRKETEVAYQKAIIELKSLQATLVGEQAQAVAGFVAAYDAALKNYNDAVDAQTEAQHALAAQIAVVDERESKKELFTRELAWEVSQGEKYLDGYKASLTEAEAELAAAKELEPHAYAEKVEELEAKRKEIILAVADLSVEAAEAVYKLQMERWPEVEALYNAYDEKWYAEQTLPMVEFDFADGTGYPLGWSGKITFEEAPYSAEYYDNYIQRLYELEYLLDAFKGWTRDENDNAWTQERIVKMKGQLADMEKLIKDVKAHWAEAVAAYKTGEYNVSDPTKISGYQDVVDALAAFNKANAAVSTAGADMVAKNTKAADTEKLTADKKAADEACTAAKKTAQDAADAKDADAIFADEVVRLTGLKTAAQSKVTTAQGVADQAEAAYIAAKVGGSAQGVLDALKKTLAEAADALTEAEDALAEAADALTDYTTAGVQAVQAEIDAELQAAIAKADADCAKAKADLDAAFAALWGAEGTATKALAAAEQAYTAAKEASAAAREALKEVSSVYNSNVDEVSPAPIKLSLIEDTGLGAYDAEKGYLVFEELTIEDLLVLNKDALIKAIDIRSNRLFGTYERTSNAYGDPDARLEELTVEEIAEEIAKYFEENELNPSANVYMDLCRRYGLLGESMALAERIRIAESWLDNGSLIAAKIKQAEDAIKAIVDADEANFLAIEEAYLAYEEAWIEYDEAHLATLEPIFAKQAEMEPLGHLYRAYMEAIRSYQVEGEYVTAEQIEAYVADCESIVAMWEEKVYSWETSVMLAKERLEKWNAGEISKKEILEDKLVHATIAVERAHEALVIAQTRLQQAMEALKWTAAE